MFFSEATMTSLTDGKPNSGLFQDGGIFFVSDAPTAESGLPRYTKLTTVTSSQLGFQSRTSVSVNSSAPRRRFVVLHRKAFEDNSARDLRVKRPAFAFQLDRLDRELRQQLVQHCGHEYYQGVWPVHCVMTSSSSWQLKHDECGGHNDDEFDRKRMMHHYARGFLVALPDMESTETMISRDTLTGSLRDTVLPTPVSPLIIGIAKTLDEHEFGIIFELVESTQAGGVWTVSKLAIPHNQITESICGSMDTINLVSLSGEELDIVERHHPAFEEQSNNVVFHSINEVSRVLTEAKVDL